MKAQWDVRDGLTDYESAVAEMEDRAAAIRLGDDAERILLVEHPPLYTAGTSAKVDGLIDAAHFPVHETGRGGEYTYHGPGQRVVYPSIDLTRHGRDVRRYVETLEGWMIAALARFDVDAHIAPGRVGVWVDTANGEAKIGAIGVRIRRWVTLHGFAVNVRPDLSHFGGIIPCGLPDFDVTSLKALGVDIDLATFDKALAATRPF
ncbi:MAG: lipoyl(octanoyl) transferase LipB [Pacificimonas sp.]